MAFRALPLALFAIAVGASFGLARELFGPGPLARMPPVLLACLPLTLRYASEVKPYVADLAVTGGLLLLVQRCRTGRRHGACRSLTVAAGALAPWLSLGAVFGVAAAALLLALPGARADRRWRVTAWILWTLSAVAAIGFARRALDPEMQAYLAGYWREGLAPDGSSIVVRLLWLPGAWLRFVERLCGAGLWVALPVAAVALLGWASLARRRAALCAALCAPVVLLSIGAIARIHPLQGRLALSAVPAIVLGIVEGARWLGSRWPSSGAVRDRLAAGALTVAAAVSLGLAPWPIGNLEPVPELLDELVARRAPEDPVYVYYGAWQAVCHYAPVAGLELEGVEIGGCHRGDPDGYLAELDRYRGRERVWVLFAHDVGGRREREAILEHLGRLGERTAALEIRGRRSDGGPAASLYRFDLRSEPAALPGTAAAPARGARPAPGCGVGPQVPPGAPAPALRVCGEPAR